MSINTCQGKYVRITNYYDLVLNYFKMQPHTHNSCEIMFVYSGSPSVEVDGNIIELKKWQYIFIDENVPHGLLIERGNPAGIINIEFGVRENGLIGFDSLLENSRAFASFVKQDKSYYVLNDSGNMYYALKDILRELNEAATPDKDYILGIILTRILIDLAVSAGKGLQPKGVNYINRAMNFISEKFDSDISVEDVAKYTRISKAYLQKLFSKQTGCGIMTYINNLRMQKAAVLLRNSTLNITDIAFETGFNSRQHFGYIFRQYYMVSPKEYRQKNGYSVKGTSKNY